MAGRSRSSGLLGAGTTVVNAGPNTLSGVVVISDSVNPATITVYDNASAASGTVLARLTATTNTGANSMAMVTPVRAENGLVVQITGTGAPTGLILYGA
jgi:hypothetical protein